jgi:hypothetical protein
MLSIAEKSRAYKLAHALQVASNIKQKAHAKAISVPEAMQLALQIHPLDWWLWELRTHRMFEDTTHQVAYTKLKSLADGRISGSSGSDDLFPEHIASCLADWVGSVNDSEHTYAGEVGFVDWAEDEGGYVVYTYDPRPEDPLDSVLRIIERL